MNRMQFLSAVLGVAGWGPSRAVARGPGRRPVDELPVIPPYLRPGDTVGILAPAGHVTMQQVAPAANLLESWGFRIRIGNTVGKRYLGFSGTDQERARDLQAMLNDRRVSAILCARGGYGMVRIIDLIDFSALRKKPKWILGFSDITVLHAHMNSCCGVATIHSKMCNSFPADWAKASPEQREGILSIRSALRGQPASYHWEASAQDRRGLAEGLLVGGNLKLLESLAGTPSDMQTQGRILFLEDTGEYLYSIDRMFWNLKRTGKLSGLKGLIIGGFRIRPDDPGEEFGMSLEEIVLEKVAEYGYPVAFGFPVGHQAANLALKCGVMHRLQWEAGKAMLQEILTT